MNPISSVRKIVLALTISLALTAPGDASRHDADEPAAGHNEERAAAVEGLKPVSNLVGEWRGVGQPKRGSRVGAWIEKAEGVWQFAGQEPALELRSDSDRQFQKIRFAWNPDDKNITAGVIVAKDQEPVHYLFDDPASSDSSFVFVDASDPDETRNRLTLRRINDIRVTLLFEQRSTERASWRRVSEVGYTRAGRRLATAGAEGPQCVVTGGLGRITVTHDGKTYRVCCEGCRQAFEADPAGTISDYKKRLKEQQTDR